MNKQQEDESRNIAQCFISRFAYKLREELAELKESGANAEDEEIQNMIHLLHGIHIIAREQAFGRIMKEQLEGDA